MNFRYLSVMMKTSEAKIYLFRKLSIILLLSNSIFFVSELDAQQIGPLIKTNWHQQSPYNDEAPSWSTNHMPRKSVAGCGAIAIAQLLRYYEYPSGFDFDVSPYTVDHPVTRTNIQKSPDNITISRSLQLRSIDYSAMSDCDYDNLNQELSFFVQAIGELIKSDYSYDVTLSNTDYIKLGLETLNYDVLEIPLHSVEFIRYWIKFEIVKGRPVLIWAGGPDNNNHFFLIDGYDEDTDEFHFNLGVGEAGNGWTSFNNLYQSNNWNENQFWMIKPATKRWIDDCKMENYCNENSNFNDIITRSSNPCPSIIYPGHDSTISGNKPQFIWQETDLDKDYFVSIESQTTNTLWYDRVPMYRSNGYFEIAEAALPENQEYEVWLSYDDGSGNIVDCASSTFHTDGFFCDIQIQIDTYICHGNTYDLQIELTGDNTSTYDLWVEDSNGVVQSKDGVSVGPQTFIGLSSSIDYYVVVENEADSFCNDAQSTTPSICDGPILYMNWPAVDDTCFVKNSSKLIQWSSSGNVNHVKISYCNLLTYDCHTIISNTANDGEFNWNIDNNISDGYYYIIIEDAINSELKVNSRIFEINSTCGQTCAPFSCGLYEPIQNSFQSIGDTIEFKWFHGGPPIGPCGPIKYHIQIDDNSSFSSPQEFERTTNLFKAVFNQATQLYWRVQVETNSGYFSPWSMVHKLHIIDTVNIPLELSSCIDYSPDPFCQNETCLVQVSVHNPTSNDWEGQLGATIIDPSLGLAPYVEVLQNQSIDAGETKSFSFSGNVSLQPSPDLVLAIAKEDIGGSPEFLLDGICSNIIPVEIENCAQSLDFEWDPSFILAGEPADFEEIYNGGTQITNWYFQGGIPAEITDNSNADDIIFPDSGIHEVTCEVLTLNNGWLSKTKYVEVLSQNQYNPDLKFTNCSLSHDSVTAGSYIDVDWLSTNERVAQIMFTYIEYFYSEDEILDENDYQYSFRVYEDEYYEYLSNSSIISDTRNIKIPSSASPGQRYIILKSRPWNSVTQPQDVDSTNDVIALPLQIVPKMVDLTLQNVSISGSNVASGEEFTIEADLMNIGNSVICGGICVNTNIYLSTDTILSSDDLNYYHGHKIIGGQGCVTSGNFCQTPYHRTKTISTLPTTPAGDYFLLYCFDIELGKEDEVDESDETNNMVAIPITISNPNQPSMQTRNLRVLAKTDTSVQLIWQNGNGQKRILVGYDSDAYRYRMPPDGVPFNTNLDWNLADNWTDGATPYPSTSTKVKMLYNGPDTVVWVTGLIPEATYFFSVFEYNETPELDYLQLNNTSKIGCSTLQDVSDGEVIKDNDNGAYFDGLSFKILNPSPNEFYAIGPQCYYSQDSFFSFRTAPVDLEVNNGLPQYIYDAEKIGDKLFACSHQNYILTSPDSGLTWNKLIFESIYDVRQCYDIHAVHDSIIFLTAQVNEDRKAIIYKSSDFGLTWSKRFIRDSTRFYHFNSIGNKVYATGRNGKIYFSNDFGENWQTHPNNLPDFSVSSIEILSEDIFLVKGGNEGVFKSVDGGSTWEKKHQFSSYCPTDVEFSFNDNKHGLYVSIDSLAYTSDAGETWNTISHDAYNCLSTYLDENGVAYLGGGNITRFQIDSLKADVYGCTDSLSHNFDPLATVSLNICESCTDGIQNGDESDVDCGGVLCTPCQMPTANTISISLDSVRFVLTDFPIANSVDTSSLIISGSLSGRAAGTYQVTDSVVMFLPNEPFIAGEMLHITGTDNIQSSGGSTIDPFVYIEPVPGSQGGTVWHEQFTGIDLTSSMYTSYHSFLGSDVDQDGLSDVVYSYTSSNGAPTNIDIYIANPSGTFQPPVNYTNFESYSSIQGTPDLNGDGYPDLVIRHNVPSRIQVRLNNGNGTFGAPTLYPVTNYTNGAVVSDLDADGDLDLIAYSGNASTSSNTLSLLFNNGDGTFQPQQTISTNAFARALSPGDLDRDGDIDLVFCTGSSSFSGPREIRTYSNDGSGSFTLEHTADNTPLYSVFRHIVDFNGDFKKDLQVRSVVSAIRYGTDSFDLDFTGLDTFHAPFADYRSADFDGDGDMDIVLKMTDTTRFYYNDGSSNFTAFDSLFHMDRFTYPDLADMDGDGDVDVFYRRDDSLFIAINGLDTSSIYGCSDTSAHNYDPLATVDDGSCETCTDGIQNGDETDVDCGGNLCMACDTSAPFIISIKTDNPGTSCLSCFTIPTIGGGYNYKVDWNDDGVYDQFGLTGDVTHDFGVAGTYSVRINGDFPRIYFNNVGDRQKITDINQWGDIEWSSMEKAFYGCSNLMYSATDAPDLTNVSSLLQMFAFATNFNGDLNTWDVSSVTNMSNMFRSTAFNGNISSWNVVNVSNFSSMFYSASSFNNDISLWNVSGANNLRDMFNFASNFNQDIGNWDVSNVQDMQYMFQFADSFNQDISSWDVGNVTNMRVMFRGATSFNQDLSAWDVSNASNLSYMFSGASAFNQNLGNWVLHNNANLESMLNNSGMDCANYTETLIGWESNNPSVVNRTLGANNLQYGNDAIAARDTLIIGRGWSITGDSPSGIDCIPAQSPCHTDTLHLIGSDYVDGIFLMPVDSVIDPNAAPIIFIRRLTSCIDFDWTSNGACSDMVPNGAINSNDLGTTFKNCLPVAMCDSVIDFEVRMDDGIGNITYCVESVHVFDIDIPGCTDSTAHNYDPLATIDDGSCETCSDGIQNGDETGVDCGGSLCMACGGLCGDLTISQFYIDTAGRFFVKVENIGTDTIFFPSSPDVVLQNYMSVDAIYNNGNEIPSGGHAVTIDYLAPGETWSRTTGFDSSQICNYPYALSIIDRDSVVDECSEENNIAQMLIADCGCTDTSAHNYDPFANIDDGSCETCSDGIQNGDETGVDCGGNICSPCSVVACVEEFLYWTDRQKLEINRSQEPYSNKETILFGFGTLNSLALDVSSGKIYWTDGATKKIQRANLDGTQVEDLVSTSGLSFPNGIALDELSGKMYWTDLGTDKIQRANLDGTQVEELVTSGLGYTPGIALDASAGKMYWTDLGTDKIQRANLDGTQVEDLVTSGLSSPSGISLDVSSGKMYWTDTGKIQRANLDGTQVEDLVTSGLSFPDGIALDASAGKMYWTDDGTDKIQRANLDGTQVEDLVTSGLSSPSGISLDVSSGKMYWTDTGTGKIQRANLDGTQVEDFLVTSGLSSPRDIALDELTGKMYWTDDDTDKIQRANLDGTQVEDLVTSGLSSTRGIALDVSSGKMYWTDNGTDKIQRANLDGTQVEDLVTSGLSTPWSIALDELSGKMYWMDIGMGKIQRANLDGTQVEDLVTSGLSFPYGIALDELSGKMYWTDIGKIQRANLDGTQVEDLVTSGLSSPYGIALDELSGKMYWTDIGTDKIQRANLDGTQVEDLVTSGLSSPHGIAFHRVIIQVIDTCHTIYTTHTSGSYSLAAAISCATPGDTLTFAPCIENDTIDGPITIDKDITIMASVFDSIFVGGSPTQPAFVIDSGVTVHIVGLHINAQSEVPYLLIENNGTLFLHECEMHAQGSGNSGILIQNTGNGTTEVIGESGVGW